MEKFLEINDLLKRNKFLFPCPREIFPFFEKNFFLRKFFDADKINLMLVNI